MNLDLSKSIPLEDSSGPQKLDLSKSIPLDDQNKSLYKANPVANEETKGTQLPSQFDKAVNFLTKPLASPEDIHKFFTSGSGNNEVLPSYEPQPPKSDPNSPLNKFVTGSGKNLSEDVSGLTSPKNIALAASTALPIVGPAIGMGIAGYNAPGMAKGIYKGGVQGYQDLKNQDYEKAGEDVTGAAANAVGLAGVMKGLLKPSYAGAKSPEIQELAQEGKLTPDEIVGSGNMTGDFYGKVARGAKRSVLTRWMAAAKGAAQDANIQSDIGDFQNDIGKTNNASIAKDVKAGLQTTENNFRAKSKELFNNVSDLAGNDKAPMTNYSNALQEHFANESELKAAGLDSDALTKRLEKAKADISENMKGEAPGKTFDQMRKIRSRLYDLAESSKSSSEAIGSPETKIYTDLAKSVEADLENLSKAKGGKVMDAYREAADYYGPGKEDLNSPLAAKMRKAASDAPNKLADIVINHGNDVQVQLAKRLLGDKFDTIKSQFTKNILDDHSKFVKGQSTSMTVPTEGGDELQLPNQSSPSGVGLAKTISDYGEALNEVYSPEELKKINDIANKANLYQTAATTKGPMPGRGAGGGGIVHSLTNAVGGLVNPLMAGALYSPLGRMLSEPAGMAALRNPGIAASNALNTGFQGSLHNLRNNEDDNVDTSVNRNLRKKKTRR